MRSVLFTVLALPLLAGCNYHSSKQGYKQPQVLPKEAPTIDDKSKIRFGAVREQILTPLCTGCHNTATATGGLDLSTYDGVMASVAPGSPADSLLYNMVDWDEMPPRRAIPPLRLLTPEEKILVRSWIEGGVSR